MELSGGVRDLLGRCHLREVFVQDEFHAASFGSGEGVRDGVRGSFLNSDRFRELGIVQGCDVDIALISKKGEGGSIVDECGELIIVTAVPDVKMIGVSGEADNKVVWGFLE